MGYLSVQFIAYEINTSPKHEYDSNMIAIVRNSYEAYFTTQLSQTNSLHLLDFYVNSWTNYWFQLYGHLYIKKNYAGLSNLQDDIQARIALIKRALEIAFSKASTDKSVLKVFMVPEFFFRGSEGAYLVDNVELIASKLSTLVEDSQWQDWLFVFGTILGFCEQYNSTDKIVFNYSLIQKGGLKVFKKNLPNLQSRLGSNEKVLRENEKTLEGINKQLTKAIEEKNNKKIKISRKTSLEQEIKQINHSIKNLEREIKRYKKLVSSDKEQIKLIDNRFSLIVQKEFKSPIDFIQKNELNSNSINKLNHDDVVHDDISLAEAKPRSEDKKVPYDPFSVFQYNNICFNGTPKPIVFGLEVCLDHAKGRLKNSQHSAIDIHLITSCGMTIYENSIASKSGGYVFLCDGGDYGGVQITKYNPSTKNWENFLRTKSVSTNNGTTTFLENIPQGLQPENVDLSPLTLDGSSKKVDIRDIYANGAGKVWICLPLFLDVPQPVQSFGIMQSLFPYVASSLTVAFSDEPILLNGMKVLFDNPTPTTPVTLQPKQRGTNNGH